MGELYGEENVDTQEWTDGLASGILREATKDESVNWNWCVFDGPVDALWIENMNTVLDDNMTLCLANGERIKLKNSMRMLFEVQDLSVASPATVSRCGMVYMTSSDLGWQPYVDSWIEKQFWLDIDCPLNKESIEYLRDLFEAYVQNSLDQINTYRDMEPIETCDL